MKMFIESVFLLYFLYYDSFVLFLCVINNLYTNLVVRKINFEFITI